MLGWSGLFDLALGGVRLISVARRIHQACALGTLDPPGMCNRVGLSLSSHHGIYLPTQEPLT